MQRMLQASGAQNQAAHLREMALMARYRGLCISCSLDTALENAKLSSAPPSSAAASSALARVDATGATPPSSIRLVRSLLPANVRGGVGWGA